MHKLLQTGRFHRISLLLLPWLSLFTCCCVAVGLYLALWASPEDYQQGNAVRIMYIHVPSAWMSLFIYTVMAIASASALIWKNPLSDMVAHSAAPIGACFTLITLFTGSIWGKPIWGTWWVWDARLTSMLVLFFFYLGYLALLHAFDNPTRAAHSAAILALVGFINVPLVKFSVNFWNTLHQPASILRLEGPSIHPSMLTPLFLMIAGAMGYFAVMLILGVNARIYERKSERQLMKQAT